MNDSSPTPMHFLFGEAARGLAVRPTPGLTVIDADGPECEFLLNGAPEITGGRGRWRYRECRGGLAFMADVETYPEFGAGVYRATLRNEGSAPRFLRFFQVRLDFDAGDAEWAFKTCGGGVNVDLYPPLPAYEIRRQHFLDDGVLSIGTRADEGRSSAEYLPILIVSRRHGDTESGFWYGMEWSGEWQLNVLLRRRENRLRCDATIPIRCLRLEPGESISFPPLHVGAFKGDDAEGSNALRRYLWGKLQPDYLGERPWPRVSYDHWFGLGNAVSDAVLRPQVERASELGIEMWVHDAGWFGEFSQDVGTWNQPATGKYPDGLSALADYVRSKGMAFGLWFEPERAFHSTWAMREYPELFFPDPQRDRVGHAGRDSYHLNLARRDAQDWVIEVIGRWVVELNLRWIRYDYNTAPAPFWRRADPTGKIQFACVAGLYRVFDELRRRYPALMIENCASGGRRIDLGTLARTHTHWFSDQTQQPEICRWMQLRAAQFLPGNCTNSSVAIGKRPGDPSNVDLAVISRMMGKLSFDGDIASLSPAATQRFRHWVDIYKQYRHLLVQDFQQLTPIPVDMETPDAVAFCTPERKEEILAAFCPRTGCASWNGALPAGRYSDLISGDVLTKPPTIGRQQAGIWHWSN